MHAPWLHQLREFELHVGDPARALIWQMRTGKTKMIIDTACHLYRAGLLDAVIILAPNGVHRNWVAREVPAHCWASVPHHLVHWDTKVAGKLASNRSKADTQRTVIWWADTLAAVKGGGLLFIAFNTESMTREDTRSLIKTVLKHRTVMLVCDESTDFRTPGSKRTYMARALGKRCAYRRILDGTILTNSLLHAYAQFEILQPGALGFTRYDEFKDHFSVWYQKNFRSRPIFVRFKNEGELRDRMAQWSSVVLRDDCADLPAVITQVVEVPLTQEQLTAYEQIRQGQPVTLPDGTIEYMTEVETEVDEATGKETKRRKIPAFMIRMQQVVSGFLIDPEGKVHDIPSVRLDMLAEEVALSAGKNIIWCQFQEDLHRVMHRLRADGRKAVEYHGSVSSKDKAAALHAFQTDPTVTEFVAQWQAAGRGLELAAADQLLCYSHSFDAIISAQAYERATKMGGRNIVCKVFIAPGIDEYIQKRVAAKISIADEVAGRGLQAILEELKHDHNSI